MRFDIQRKQSQKDELHFDLAWSLNREMEIVYQFDRIKDKSQHHFLLKGRWQLMSDRYLVYRLEGRLNYELRARAFLQTKQLRSKKGELRYRIGIGFYKKKRKHEEISLIGTWRLSQSLSVDFILAHGHKNSYTFRVSSAHFTPHKISLALRLTKRQRLSLRLEVDRFFFASSHAFIQWSQSLQKEAVLKTGVRVSF